MHTGAGWVAGSAMRRSARTRRAFSDAAWSTGALGRYYESQRRIGRMMRPFDVTAASRGMSRGVPLADSLIRTRTSFDALYPSRAPARLATHEFVRGRDPLSWSSRLSAADRGLRTTQLLARNPALAGAASARDARTAILRGAAWSAATGRRHQFRGLDVSPTAMRLLGELHRMHPAWPASGMAQQLAYLRGVDPVLARLGRVDSMLSRAGRFGPILTQGTRVDAILADARRLDLMPEAYARGGPRAAEAGVADATAIAPESGEVAEAVGFQVAEPPDVPLELPATEGDPAWPSVRDPAWWMFEYRALAEIVPDDERAALRFDLQAVGAANGPFFYALATRNYPAAVMMLWPLQLAWQRFFAHLRRLRRDYGGPER